MQKLIYLLVILIIEIVESVAFSWSSVVKRVYIYTTGLKELTVLGEKLKWNPVPLFPDCQHLDFLDYFDFENYSSLIMAIELNKIQNTGITLHLQERNKAVYTFV